MLSYQHIYHAGNVIDCQKHTILCALLSLLQNNPMPIHYIDTHAGRGLYDLTAFEAEKLQEYRQGIDRLWEMPSWPIEIKPYETLLEKLNPEGICRFYPGSPYVAHNQLRPQDQAELYELHPQEVAALHQNMGAFAQVTIHQLDGWLAMAQSLPSDVQRLIFIDPSYELKDEYRSIGNHIKDMLNHNPDSIIMLWYPLLAANRHTAILETLRTKTAIPILQNEILISQAEMAKGLYGTGILVLNPPKNFEKTVKHLSQWVSRAIGIHATTRLLHSGQ